MLCNHNIPSHKAILLYKPINAFRCGATLVAIHDIAENKITLSAIKKHLKSFSVYAILQVKSTHSKVDAPKLGFILTDVAYPVCVTG